MCGLTRAGRAAAVAVVAAIAASGCGSMVAPLTRAASPTPSIRPVDEHGAVRWVDRPGRFFEPSPLPTHRLPANARPCTSAELRVFPEGGDGGGGHSYQTFALRNVSRMTCILRGYPSVVASQPGRPDVTAADGGFFVGRERSANMPPGGTTRLNIETERDCSARYANPGRYPTLLYHTVTIGIAGGGQVVIHQPFDVLCGLYTGRFAVSQPPQRYTRSPVSGARAALELPGGAVAGTTLHYVVDLTNPTGTAMTLQPCPGYEQGIGSVGKNILELNCAVRRLPAHRTVRFAMELAVPGGTPAGPATVHWQIAGPFDVAASGSLHVYGRDTPCRPSQLRVVITVTLTRGWTPPPCRGTQPGSAGHPGLVSADQFRPA